MPPPPKRPLWSIIPTQEHEQHLVARVLPRAHAEPRLVEHGAVAREVVEDKEEEGEGEEWRDAVVEDLVRRLNGLGHEDDGEDPVEDVVRGGPEGKVL